MIERKLHFCPCDNEFFPHGQKNWQKCFSPKAGDILSGLRLPTAVV